MAVAVGELSGRHTRIAHLSDLHCDGSGRWSDGFDMVQDLLVKERPDAVLITGDCVDHPRRQYFRMLKERLIGLKRELTGARGGGAPVLIITIPGNHDFNFFGNHVWSWQRRRPMQDELAAFLAAGVFNSDLADFARTHGIMLFPFDSNRTSLGMFARGRVDDPQRRFKEMDREYRMRLGCEHRWGNCVRLALLHHHPLPLPDTRAGQKLEAFHILDNANEFLRAACDFRVDLILHGHKHVSGIAEYRYGAGIVRPHGVYVSACGTSAQLGARVQEICLFDILRSGSVFLKRARRLDGDGIFRIEDQSEAARRVVPYSHRRKRRVQLDHPWSLGPTRIRSVGTKTKVVRIIENGRGYVKITLDGLQWSNEVPQPSQIYRECIHGGIGRVAGGWYRYLGGQGHGRSELKKLEMSPAQVRSSLTHFEEVSVELPAPGSLDAQPGRFELKYLLHNGYCTSARDFFESFYDDRDAFCEEASTIEVLGPTEMAELIVTFPRNCLPAEESLRLEAWIVPNDRPRIYDQVMRGSYVIDEEETAFLNRKGAVRYRRELNQVSVMVRHPQPGRAYTLRWSLAGKAKVSRSNIPAWHLNYARRLSELDDATHAQVETLIRETLSRFDLRVSIAIYEPPSEERLIGKMTIVQPQPRLSTLVGRGILGQAFRTRRLQYRNKRGGDELADAETFQDTDPDIWSEDVIDWGDDVVCEPLNGGLIELLVIPLIADDNKNAKLPVAGALIISRGNGSGQSDFFPYDLDQLEGCRKAEEWLRPLVGVVETAIGWPPGSS